MEKIAIIVEDKKNTILGNLLSNSFNKDNIHFSESNTKIYKKIKEIYGKYDKIIVFYDLVPNNKYLYETLEVNLDRLSSNNMTEKVFIIPVVCSEYIYLTAIQDFLDIRISDFALSNTVNYHKSCEKYYKRYLKHDKKFGIIPGGYSEYEGDYFYCSFPVFDVVSSKHKEYLKTIGVDTEEVSLDDIQKKVEIFYSDLYKLFGLDFNEELNIRGLQMFKIK